MVLEKECALQMVEKFYLEDAEKVENRLLHKLKVYITRPHIGFV
jgi:hypothetical protein